MCVVVGQFNSRHISSAAAERQCCSSYGCCLLSGTIDIDVVRCLEFIFRVELIVNCRLLLHSIDILTVMFVS